MKSLSGTAAASTDVPLERCVRVLADVGDYPAWYPEVVLAAEVLESGEDGLPARAEVTLRVAHGPISRDLDMQLAVTVEQRGLVRLERVARGGAGEEAFQVTWRLAAGQPTRLELSMSATLPVPRLVPLGGVGESFASGFMSAAVARLAREL